MDLHLKDKVVIVTGGASGIGAAIVTGAAREGAVAVIVDKSAEAAHDVECEVKKSGGQAYAVIADLMEAENCRRAIDEALERCGRIDALVNNAGLNDRVGLEHGSPAEYVKSIERNLLHYYNLAHYALPSLKETRGSIVNIASKTAVTGQGGTSGYASSKGAILALTREWALELLPYEIRVNAVLPAEVWTPMYKNWIAGFPDPEHKLGEIVSRIPFAKRMTTPEEIAAMALFLLSSQAGHITGQHLYVDGGYVHLDRALS
jgi:NAD(P)-dependent dehydrogenase (short-subunit alcohol dehydrogenase family)